MSRQIIIRPIKRWGKACPSHKIIIETNTKIYKKKSAFYRHIYFEKFTKLQNFVAKFYDKIKIILDLLITIKFCTKFIEIQQISKRFINFWKAPITLQNFILNIRILTELFYPYLRCLTSPSWYCHTISYSLSSLLTLP